LSAVELIRLRLRLGQKMVYVIECDHLKTKEKGRYRILVFDFRQDNLVTSF